MRVTARLLTSRWVLVSKATCALSRCLYQALITQRKHSFRATVSLPSMAPTHIHTSYVLYTNYTEAKRTNRPSPTLPLPVLQQGVIPQHHRRTQQLR